MEIGEQIDLLVDLQKLDTEIFAFNRIKIEFPAKIKDLEERFAKESASLKQADDALKHLMAKQNDKENELALKEEQVKKCEGQLYMIKTNKEYDAMKLEISGHNADKSVLEDGILAIFDEIETKKNEVDKEKALLKEAEAKLNAEKAKCASELREIEGKLGGLNAERAQQTAKVDKTMLVKYEKILKGKDGSAMAEVVHDSCGGCHLNIPPQVINEIKMKREIIFCESCARILYIENGKQ